MKLSNKYDYLRFWAITNDGRERNRFDKDSKDIFIVLVKKNP